MLRLLTAGLVTVGVASMVPLASAGAAGTAVPAQAQLVGQLGYEGGAAPGPFHPGPGTVEVEFRDQPLVLLHHVGPSGNFRIRLGSGSYTVIGCGPSASAGSPSGQCSGPKNVTLAPGQVDHIRLVWALVP